MTWQELGTGLLGKLLIACAAFTVFALATGIAVLAAKFLIWTLRL